MDSLELEKAHVEEGEQEDPEADPENNNLCHQPLVAGRLVERARSTNITGVNDVAIDENGEAIEWVEASNVPHPHEVDADADRGHQDSGAQPFNNVVDAKQQDHVIEDQAGLLARHSHGAIHAVC